MESESTASESCEPCKTASVPLGPHELAGLASTLPAGWRIIDNHHLEYERRCRDFQQAFHWSTIVAAIAAEQGHHPIVCTRWGLLTIQSLTNRVNGLTARDFVLARAIDNALRAAAAPVASKL